MTLSAFLIQILKTHASTLQHLAAYFGEEVLFELLELAAENHDEDPDLNPEFHLDLSWFYLPNPSLSQGYAEIEGAVLELKLPEVLEFHLWAYPFYRKFVESSLDLKMSIYKENGAIEALVEEALYESQLWIKRLPLPSQISQHAERIAQTPWIRFRSEVLKKSGKRPFQSI